MQERTLRRSESTDCVINLYFGTSDRSLSYVACRNTSPNAWQTAVSNPDGCSAEDMLLDVTSKLIEAHLVEQDLIVHLLLHLSLGPFLQ
jgi:hypothetical protein